MALRVLSDLAGTLLTAFKVGRATLSASGLSAARTVTLPDKSGTVAMLDDVGGGSAVPAALNTLLAGAAVSMRDNPRTRGLHPDPPTVTVGTGTAPGGFTRIYPFEASNSPFVYGGGVASTTSGITSFLTCTPSGSTAVGRHWRVETILDGDEVSFLLDSATADGYRFLVDGQYVSLTGTTSSAGDPRYYTLTFASRGRRRITVEGHTSLRFDEARVPDDCTLLPPERANPVRMIVVGDSNIEAYPIALKGDGIGAILSDQFGIVDVWASGVFGTGFVATNGGASYTYAQRRTDWTTRSPDVLVMFLSINDIVAGASQATIKTAVATELTQARSALPGVPIIIVGVVASEDFLSANSLLTLGQQQETGATEAVDEFDDPLVTIIPTLNAAIDSPFTGLPGSGNWDLYVDGSTHATAAGQLYGGQWLSHRIIDALATMAGVPPPVLAMPPVPQALSTLSASGAVAGDMVRFDGVNWVPSTLGPADFWIYERIGSQTVSAPTAFLSAAIGSGTNTTAIPAASLVEGSGGGVFLRSSTAADGGYRYLAISTDTIRFGVGTRKFRGHFLWRTSFTGRTVRIGFIDTITVADATDGVYFEVVGATCSAKTANNSTRTTAGTTATLSLDTVYTFDIDVNAAGTSARLRVYAGNSATPVLDQTITNNIPTATNRATGVGIVATEGSTTASDIGILYGMGYGTIAAFQRVLGPS